MSTLAMQAQLNNLENVVKELQAKVEKLSSETASPKKAPKKGTK